AAPVVFECGDLRAGVLPNRALVDPALVDVVAEEDHQVQIVLCEVAMRRVVSGLVVLARCESQLEPVRLRVYRGGRSRPADRTDLAARDEPVPVDAVGG